MSISAMKQALEALALFASDESDDGQMAISAYEALRQAIEQAEKQKPSLWFAIGGDGRVKYTTDSDRALKWKQAGSYRLVRDYYPAPVHARQEWAMQQMVAENQKLGLYDAPKEWVGLTDEESEHILKEFGDDPRFMAIEIEVRLMEKNT